MSELGLGIEEANASLDDLSHDLNEYKQQQSDCVNKWFVSYKNHVQNVNKSNNDNDNINNNSHSNSKLKKSNSEIKRNEKIMISNEVISYGKYSIILYDQFLQFNNFQLGILLNKINLKNYDAILLTSDLVPGELLKFNNLKLLKIGV